jgi:hypothetical protein
MYVHIIQHRYSIHIHIYRRMAFFALMNGGTPMLVMLYVCIYYIIYR